MRLPLLIRTCMLFAILSIATIAQATNYYVDASTTSSTQNGSLANPWKTLSQVSNNMGLFQPGDFILFKRGQTFTGTLYPTRGGTASAPLTFGAYGTGAKPKFTGTGSTIGYLFYVNNKSYIIFRDLWITDPSIDNADRSIDAKIQRAFTFDQSATNNKIISCDIHLVGVAGYFIGGYNTMDSCDVGNLRMVVDSDQGYQPGNDDDYGANPLVISSANNTITHNYFHDCWATSYDYDFDGGAIEFYGSGTDNNFIGYNTIYDCIGLSEITGNSANNTYAYNKLINNGSLFYFQSGYTYSGYKVYNNVIVENSPSRVPESRLIGGSMSTGAVIMKNNVFQMSNGIDVASNTSAIAHEDNIYKMSNNSVVGYTVGSSELNTTAAIFTNTTAAIPTTWNYAPATASPAIDFGQNVGLTKDFAGNPVPAVPNSGILESAVSGPALVASSSGAPIICNGGTTSITVSANGGTSPYTGTGTFTVNAGTYTYSVSDAGGQTASTTITVSQPAAISVSVITGTITTYGGTTNATVSATGGTGSYTYKLNNGSYQASNIFTGVVAGSHSVTVKDVNGCTSVKAFTLTQPSAPAPFTAASTAGTISCFGGSATVTVSATGGTSPYTGTGSFTVSAGTYTYTITDANAATTTTTITITHPTAISVTIAAGTIATYGGTTSVTANANGGTGSYTYKLNNGSYQSSNSFTNIAAGNHEITVKDANGCTSVKTFTLSQPSAPDPLQASAIAGTINCNGGTTTVTVSVTGGTAPYTGTGSFTVNAGTYSYTVTDAIGATTTTAITVTQPSIIVASANAGTITVNGGTTSVTVNAAGGTGDYTYKLNNGAYQPSNTFTGVAAGSHVVTVKDENGCTATTTLTLTEPAANTLVVTATATPILCNSAISTITVSASGGTAPYTGTGLFTGYAGTYSYTVTDATGAAATTTITITQPTAISVTVNSGSITSTGGTTDVTVSATGGTAPYSYMITGGTYQSSGTFTGVAAGTYAITVRDANGCTAVKTITIASTSTAGLRLTLVFKTDATCRGSNTGAIEVIADGGRAPYMYKLNNGRFTTSPLFKNLRAGSYRITTKDANGNTASLVVYVFDGRRICNGGSAFNGRLIVTGYPNPTTTRFTLTIQSEDDSDVVIEVMNQWGRKVYETRGSVQGNYVFGEHFRPGTYFIRLTQGNKITTQTLIKL